MDNKKLGLIIIWIGVLFALGVLAFSKLANKTDSSFCIASLKPAVVTSHILIGVVFSTLSLGVYLLFFEKSHQILLKKLKDNSSLKSKEEKFNFILMGLNEDEKRVLTAIKDQDGITQHTLGIRTNLHKSKLSIIVGILEQKGLIKKEKKGKTNQLFLRMNL